MKKPKVKYIAWHGIKLQLTLVIIKIDNCHKVNIDRSNNEGEQMYH
jgi:hypothetical protein